MANPVTKIKKVLQLPVVYSPWDLDDTLGSGRSGWGHLAAFFSKQEEFLHPWQGVPLHATNVRLTGSQGRRCFCAVCATKAKENREKYVTIFVYTFECRNT